MTRFLLSLVVLYSFACSRVESLDVAEDISPDSPLEIAVLTSPSTKGVVVEEPVDMGSVGIYCAMTGVASWSSGADFSKLPNQRYYFSDDEVWTIDGDAVSWGYDSFSDKYTFFAYSPYYEDAQGVTPSLDGGELVIDYTVPPLSEDQPDLMYAMPRKDIYPQTGGAVSLTFYHTLACVSFGIVSSTNRRITAIEITGVNNSGRLVWDYTNGSPEWSLGELGDDSFSVAVEDYILDDDDSAQLNTDKGYLMMIPQQLTDGALVVLTLDDNDTRSLTIPAGSVWEAGSKYDYTIRLDDEECDYYYRSNNQSNCYIINPTAGEDTVVQIPVEDRINNYWLNYGYYYYPLRILPDTPLEEFSVSLLWDDFVSDLEFDYEFLRDVDGKVALRLYFEAEYQEGNLLFAVLGAEGTYSKDLLWSWHLWFTDYNPNMIASENRQKIVAGVEMEYTLDGYEGAVHRYADAADVDEDSAVWSGMYKDKFIMDRNIGELSDHSEKYGVGSIYYQYGRKDPFPGSSGVYTVNKGELELQAVDGYSIWMSIYDPYVFYTPKYDWFFGWCDDSTALDAIYIWYDKAVTAEGYTEGKSLFDPSPLGWRVPVSDTWSSFKTSEDGQVSESVKRFYPYYFGYRDPFDDATLTEGQEVGYVWSANQMDGESSYCFSYSDTNSTPLDVRYALYALPVRAIEE